MEAASSQTTQDNLPPQILSLPKVEVPVAGVTGYCLSNDERQLVFFIFEEGGEMILEIEGQTELYQAGDQYRVPEGANHRANFSKRTVLVDLTDTPDRYKVGN